MTDKQRYRPLAECEIPEKCDECRIIDDPEDDWVPSGNWKYSQPQDYRQEYRRPIPETDWREPVGDAGYPYPPGTVVEEKDYALWLLSEAHEDSIAVRVYEDADGYCRVENSIWLDNDCYRTMKHRVIDYRPDLLAHQTASDESQTPLSRTDETEAELTRLRAEVERYRASAENIRDFADLFKQERDEARAEVQRLKAELAKYQPTEYKSIDLTESTVFVGAAWGESEGEIQ